MSEREKRMARPVPCREVCTGAGKNEASWNGARYIIRNNKLERP